MDWNVLHHKASVADNGQSGVLSIIGRFLYCVGVMLGRASVCWHHERENGFIMLFSIVLVVSVWELQSRFSLIISNFSTLVVMSCAVWSKALAPPSR